MGQLLVCRQQYYLESKCQCCGSKQRLHIGWRDTNKPFVFRNYVEIGSYSAWVKKRLSYSAWVKKLLEGDIRDGDGKQIDLRSFLQMVEKHKEDLGSNRAPSGTFWGAEHYLFCKEESNPTPSNAP